MNTMIKEEIARYSYKHAEPLPSKDTGLNITFPDGRKFIIERKSTRCFVGGGKKSDCWYEEFHYIREEMPKRKPKARYLDIDDSWDTRPNFTFVKSGRAHGLTYHKAEILLFLLIPLIKERLYEGQDDVAMNVRWDWNGKRELITSWGWWNGRNNLGYPASMQGERI